MFFFFASAGIIMGHVTPLVPVRLIWVESKQKSKNKKQFQNSDVKIRHGSTVIEGGEEIKGRPNHFRSQ